MHKLIDGDIMHVASDDVCPLHMYKSQKTGLGFNC